MIFWLAFTAIALLLGWALRLGQDCEVCGGIEYLIVLLIVEDPSP